MDFAPSEEQRLALDGWRRMIAHDIAPITARYCDSVIPKDTAHELLRRTTGYGIGNGWIRETDGGAGLDFLSSGLLYEELARTSPDLAGLAFVTEGAALKLANAGSPALKARYLPQLLTGKLIGCSAISEPDVGSSVREMRTRAVRDGHYFRIRGEKMWTSNASIADLVILTARSGEDEFTMFLLDRAEHSFTTRDIPKLGLNGWSLGQVVLEDVVVPETNVIGKVGAGLGETMRGFERSRCFISTLALGIASAALEAGVSYAQTRKQFGKLIAGHQLIQGMLAEMATELDAARLLVYRALWLMTQGLRCELEASMAKSYTTEAALRIASKAIQVHGAFGISREFPVERHFRNARMLTLPDGTTQINQLIIGRKLTGIDAFR